MKNCPEKVGRPNRQKENEKRDFGLSSGNVQNVYFAVLLWASGCTFSTVANSYIFNSLIHAIKGQNTSALKVILMFKHKW